MGSIDKKLIKKKYGADVYRAWIEGQRDGYGAGYSNSQTAGFKSGYTDGYYQGLSRAVHLLDEHALKAAMRLPARVLPGDPSGSTKGAGTKSATGSRRSKKSIPAS